MLNFLSLCKSLFIATSLRCTPLWHIWITKQTSSFTSCTYFKNLQAKTSRKNPKRPDLLNGRINQIGNWPIFKLATLARNTLMSHIYRMSASYSHSQIIAAPCLFVLEQIVTQNNINHNYYWLAGTVICFGKFHQKMSF